MFQLTFAIITPALVIGALAERTRFSALLLFSTLWFHRGVDLDGLGVAALR